MTRAHRKEPSTRDTIVVKGAREHNLKNVELALPKNALIVFTGPSGSGKSSLAFDTLYAEGQRRYVESLSSYARQFLGQMEKPKVDHIRGLVPTIAIEQKAASSNPRSTVGTVTEIHDYLRVLWARAGEQTCHLCGDAVGARTAESIATDVLTAHATARVEVLAPLARQKKGEFVDVLEGALARGFTRARVDARLVDLSVELPRLDKKSKHDVDLVIDRLVARASDRPRLVEALEVALREGDGLAVVLGPGGEVTYSSRRACVACGTSYGELGPQSFSFNSPVGCCGECNGLGSRPEMDPELVVTAPQLSIRAGAIGPWTSAMDRGEGWTADSIEAISRTFGVDLDRPWATLPKAQRDLVLFGGTRGQRAWEGLCNQLLRRLKATHSDDMKQYYLRWFSDKPCPACEGARLRPESRAVKVGDAGLHELSRMTIADAVAFVSTLKLSGERARVAAELTKEIRARLGFLVDVGLSYLTLDRAAATLSGGESQRIRLAAQVGSELTGVLYVLDEPSIGLHPRDNEKLLRTLCSLRDLGNTVLVVEHDEETMRRADLLVDFGPGAGEAGGRVVASGTPAAVQADARSPTGAYLSGQRAIPLPATRRLGNGRELTIVGARANNLKSVTVAVPLGRLVCVTGVSGAGKSSLIGDILVPSLARTLHGAHAAAGAHDRIDGVDALDRVVLVDQQPIGRTPRSNPATYTKLFDGIREVFAKTPEARARGYEAGRFSFNVRGGRCEACGGDGQRRVEMHFLPDVFVTCDECQGRRFNDATLKVTFKGRSIADVLDTSVSDALALFSAHRDVARGLRTLDDVGLGYLRLGQPSPTLSGGEAQRIKLARELSRSGAGRSLYVLDEPTTGLHFGDVERLLEVLGRLVDAGSTVVVIEHHLDVIAAADWIIDVGPDGGQAGGRVVAEGTPEQVSAARHSVTGRFLAEHLARRRPQAKRARPG